VAIERVDQDANPGARATHTFGRQGAPVGVSFDSEGNATFGGDLTVVGAIAAGSGLGGASNPYGLGCQTVDPMAGIVTTYSLGAGTLVLCLMALSTPITKLGTWLKGAGTTSSGSNRLALYHEDGTLIDTTGDMTTDFSTSGQRCIEGDLTLGEFDPGGTIGVYIGALTHFSAGNASLAGTPDVGTSFVTINGHRPSIFLAGQTSPPASFSPAGASVNSAAYYFYGR
jgi:hypothetical protein